MNEGITLNLVSTPALSKDGKQIKDPNGEPQFSQEDGIGLLILLNQYDTRKHGSFMKQSRLLIETKDKIKKAWTKNEKEVKLTGDETEFLKEYLTKLPENEGKEKRFEEFELRTMMGVLEQLA